MASSSPSPSAETAPSLGRHVIAALCCGAIVAVVAVAPHLVQWRNDGRLEYLASGDDVIYLAVARPAYYGESRLRDPYSLPSDDVPTAFSWFQFVPYTAPIGSLDVPFLLAPLVWRVIGGLLTGAAAYFLAACLVGSRSRRIAFAIGLTLFLINDAGTIGGRPIVDTVKLVRQLVNGTFEEKLADGFHQYRIVNPLLNLPWLLTVIAVVVSGRRSWPWLVAAGVAIGVCTLTYFFFWTGLVGALGLYATLQLVRWRLGRPDAGGEFRFVLGAILVGLIVGGYQIVSNSMTFADPSFREALDRTSLGYRVPAGDPIRTQYLVNTIAIGTFAIAAAALVWRWSNALALSACLTLSGYLLRNSAIVTGLEFENYHWSTVQNLGVALVWIRLALDMLPDRDWVGWTVLTLGLASAGFALVWRGYESTKCAETIACNETLASLRPLAPALAALSPDCSLAGPDETKIAILMSRCGQLFNVPHTSHRSLIPDSEVHLRHAANAWLQGLTAEEYDTIAAGGFPMPMTESPRPEWRPAAVAAARSALFRQIVATPSLIDRFHADAVLSRIDRPTPPGGPWREAARTDRWILRVKDPS